MGRVARLKPYGRRGSSLSRKDAAHRKRLIERDGERCQLCGRSAPQDRIDVVHIYGKKAHPHLRWSMLNTFMGCWLCHGEMHRSPTFWKAAVASVVGGYAETLRKMADYPIGVVEIW